MRAWPRPSRPRISATSETRSDRRSPHSLGAAAGHLRTTGGDYAPYNAKLIDNLKNAGSADERRALVGSIGNVGAPENVPVLAGMTSDEDPDVQRSVARAMRKVDALEARDVLFNLIGDSDIGVGRPRSPRWVIRRWARRTWSGSSRR